MPDNVTAFAEAGENPADLWAAVDGLRTEADRAALLERASKEEARCAEALREAGSAADRRAIQHHSDQVVRAARAAKLSRLAEAADDRSPAVRHLDSLMGGETRERTRANREAFLLTETVAHAGVNILPPEPARADVVLPPASDTAQAARERAALREQQAGARWAGFVQFLGEVVYAALPLDEHEKLPARNDVLTETAAAFVAAGKWKATPATAAIVEAVAELLDDCPDPSVAVGMVEEACAPGAAGRLRQILEAHAPEIEHRTVGAVAGARERAAAVERQLALTEGSEGSDPALRELRIRRAVERQAPTVIESLFVANRNALREATGAQPSEGLVLAEAVCQYALLETLSAYGILDLRDPDKLIRALVRPGK